MIPDPLETAAWRSFGMLDADESATFDETARHDTELRNACRDMDRLAAAIALTTATPVAPRAGQLERLHHRLGLPARKRLNWPAISGWAAAVVLGLLPVIRPHPHHSSMTIAQPPATPESRVVTNDGSLSPTVSHVRPGNPASPMIADSEIDPMVPTGQDSNLLNQEVVILRGELESLQSRDRERFETTPGMAWPVVMRMVPPDFSSGAASANSSKEDPTLTAMLGDAMAISQETAKTSATIVRPESEVPSNPVPTAIPIYDSARDKGTLVVSNLPPKNAGESYNLWVTTAKGDKPIHVGRLPDSGKPGANSMDFSLGATSIVPSGFLLTRDKEGNPPPPSETTTILVGPR